MFSLTEHALPLGCVRLERCDHRSWLLQHFCSIVRQQSEEEAVDERQLAAIMTRVMPHLTPSEQSVHLRLW